VNDLTGVHLGANATGIHNLTFGIEHAVDYLANAISHPILVGVRCLSMEFEAEAAVNDFAI
jgi:hypothetical protein